MPIDHAVVVAARAENEAEAATGPVATSTPVLDRGRCYGVVAPSVYAPEPAYAFTAYR
ncbi:hypothetical protein GCM10010488_18570 [Oerskovia jenensis]|uniref:Pyruvate/2-oxoacid:ferredoxin oxidoreductase delta subunit n=1 Tax=Oerskovia jenensis TaxID=162169 RepID=A0ABS2LE19_9CELL|nr:Pyruvate/2-oxoacid:ferredoxin oxidoreductase delta subunit [Oerskovia jenensis]